MGRVAVDPGRQRAEHRTGRLHDVRREPGRLRPGPPGLVGQAGDGAEGGRRGREVRAVRAGADRCGVEVTGPDRPGVERDPAHDRLGEVPAVGAQDVGAEVPRDVGEAARREPGRAR